MANMAHTVEDLGMRVLCGADPSAPAPMTRPPDPPGVSVARSIWGTIYAIVTPVSSAACFYHGLKRNDSIGWGFGWSVLGGLFPVVAPIYAVYEGFGVPKALSKRP